MILLESLKNKNNIDINLLGGYYDTFKFENGRYQGQFGYASIKFLTEVANGMHKEYEIKESVK